MTLIGKPQLPANNYKELMSWVQANKGKINLGNAGVGSASHLTAELFKTRADVEMLHVPNKGGASASIKDVATGDVHVAPMNVATAGPMVRP